MFDIFERATFHKNAGQYEKAIIWYKKCLDLYLSTIKRIKPQKKISPENINLYKDLARIYNLLAECYAKLGQNKEAINYYNTCHDLYLEKHAQVKFSKECIISTYSNLADLYKQESDILPANIFYGRTLYMIKLHIKELRRAKNYTKILRYDRLVSDLKFIDLTTQYIDPKTGKVYKFPREQSYSLKIGRGFNFSLIKRLQPVILSEIKFLSTFCELEKIVEKMKIAVSQQENKNIQTNLLSPLNNMSNKLRIFLSEQENLEFIKTLCFLSICVNKHTAINMLNVTLRVLNSVMRELQEKISPTYLKLEMKMINKALLTTESKFKKRLEKRKAKIEFFLDPKTDKKTSIEQAEKKISFINNRIIKLPHILEILSTTEDSTVLKIMMLLGNDPFVLKDGHKYLDKSELVFFTQNLKLKLPDKHWKDLFTSLKKEIKVFENATKNTSFSQQAEKITIIVQSLYWMYYDELHKIRMLRPKGSERNGCVIF